MNRIITFAAIAALSATMLNARELTPSEAWNRATSSREATLKVRGASTTTQRLVKTVNTADNQPAYYVFNTGDRTVFTSADDVAAPVLGYTEGQIEDMTQIPPALSYMLETYVRQIEWAKAKGIQTSYTSTRSGDRAPVEPLVQTKWDQGSPYNDLCPMKNNERTYTGCVVTATVQAMGYYRYPTIGQGNVSYEWNGQTLSTNLSESPIRWDDILLTYTKDNPGTESQRSAIASLMRDAGYASHIEYGLDADGGTLGNLYTIPSVLVDNYNYDLGVRHENHVYYSQTDWENLIYDELAASRPVVYSGQGSHGGHAFICDGYNHDGLFHINWGWSGHSDGYFALTALDPYTLGAGGGEGGFNFYQGAVVGIQLPQQGSVAPDPFIGTETAIYADGDDRTVNIHPEMDDMIAGAYRNHGREKAVFTLGVRLVSESDGTETYIADKNITNVEFECENGRAVISVEIPKDIPEGRYKAYPAYKYNGVWKDVRFPYGAPDYIGLTITGSSVDIDPESGRPEVKIASVSTPSTMVVNMPYSIEIIMLNTTPTEAGYYFAVYITDSTEDMLNIPLVELGEADGKIEAHSRKTIPIQGVLEQSMLDKDLEIPGDYFICINDEATTAKYFPVKITDSSSGIEGVASDTEGAANIIYDLSGRRVNTNNLVPGVYIKVSGATREKILIP